MFLREDVEKLGAPFVLATMDGSAGVKGLVTDALPEIDVTDICACGPLPMLKAIMNADDHPAQPAGRTVPRRIPQRNRR